VHALIHTVPKISYIGFQIWDTVQGGSSYVRGMLSSHAVMTGIGVGKEVRVWPDDGPGVTSMHGQSNSRSHYEALKCLIQAATAYGAVFLFAVRDLTGMLGSLVFAHIEVGAEQASCLYLLASGLNIDSNTTQGSGFDSCAKQWRLFADIMNDIGG